MGAFRHGKQVGRWVRYDLKGELYDTWKFVDGVQVGAAIRAKGRGRA